MVRSLCRQEMSIHSDLAHKKFAHLSLDASYPLQFLLVQSGGDFVRAQCRFTRVALTSGQPARMRLLSAVRTRRTSCTWFWFYGRRGRFWTE